MPKIVISQLEQYPLTDEQYKYLQANLNKPLDVVALTYMPTTGKLWQITIAIVDDRGEFASCATLFLDLNKPTYKLEGELQ